MSHATRLHIFQRFWKPVVAVGAGGTAIAFWFEELMLFADEVLAIILLPIMAGIIYLLDLFIFKSYMPKREDLITPTHRGEKK
jgi:hypothetical protein